MAGVSQRAALDTDGVNLCHLVGNGQELRHGSERLAEIVHVETCHDDAHAVISELVANIHDAVVEELSLVYAYHVVALRGFQDGIGVGHGG